MGVNLDKPDRWKADVAKSVDMYNDWFLKFAPKAFRETRVETTKAVEHSLGITRHLRDIGPETFRANPTILPTLRMSTCPPLAVDRLVGLAGVSDSLVDNLEKKQRLPPRMPAAARRDGVPLAERFEGAGVLRRILRQDEPARRKCAEPRQPCRLWLRDTDVHSRQGDGQN